MLTISTVSVECSRRCIQITCHLENQLFTVKENNCCWECCWVLFCQHAKIHSLRFYVYGTHLGFSASVMTNLDLKISSMNNWRFGDISIFFIIAVRENPCPDLQQFIEEIFVSRFMMTEAEHPQRKNWDYELSRLSRKHPLTTEEKQRNYLFRRFSGIIKFLQAIFYLRKLMSFLQEKLVSRSP